MLSARVMPCSASNPPSTYLAISFQMMWWPSSCISTSTRSAPWRFGLIDTVRERRAYEPPLLPRSSASFSVRSAPICSVTPSIPRIVLSIDRSAFRSWRPSDAADLAPASIASVCSAVSSSLWTLDSLLARALRDCSA